MSAPMFLHCKMTTFACILAAILASSFTASAQRGYAPRADQTIDAVHPQKKTGTTDATGYEKDGVYEETEVRQHSWFSFSRPAEATPAAQIERADRFRDKGNHAAAAKAYQSLVLTWPRAPQAAVAQQRHAEALEQQGEFEDAFTQYDALIDRYTGGFDYNEIIKRQFDLAKKVMNKRKGKFLFFGGFKAPERAIPMFESILKHAPRWDGAPEAEFGYFIVPPVVENLEP